MADFMDNFGLTYYTNTAVIGTGAGNEKNLQCKTMVSQDYDYNQSEISWHIYFESLGSLSVPVSNIKLTIDNKVVYENKSTQNLTGSTSPMRAIASGELVLDHAYNGSKVLSIKLEGAINGQTVSGTSTINLPNIPRLSTVSVNTVDIGSNPTFTISKADTAAVYPSTSRMTTTLRYKVGTEEGTIVSRTSATTYNSWTLPIEWVLMFPNSKEGEGTIYCDAYNKNGVFTGTTTTKIKFTIPEKPSLAPTVVDTSSQTLALTGDENTLVRFFSDVAYKFNAVPGTGAALRKYKLETGGEVIEDKTAGTIQDVESGEFIFSVTDSRGYIVTETVNKNFLEYKKLTCNLWRKRATADGTIEVGIKGDYWAHWFGTKHNTLKISYRYKVGAGEFGDWIEFDYLTDTDDYEASITLKDLDYQTTYTFEAMAQDELMTVVSRQLPVHCLPVYDWGRDDFNVNVNFKMNNQTVLRHNHTANNLVVSSSGGFIYFRPKGTNDTSAEIKFTPQGNIELTGDILIGGKSLKSLLGI